jgi:hypothetical protein
MIVTYDHHNNSIVQATELKLDNQLPKLAKNLHPKIFFKITILNLVNSLSTEATLKNKG